MRSSVTWEKVHWPVEVLPKDATQKNAVIRARCCSTFAFKNTILEILRDRCHVIRYKTRKRYGRELKTRKTRLKTRNEEIDEKVNRRNGEKEYTPPPSLLNFICRRLLGSKTAPTRLEGVAYFFPQQINILLCTVHRTEWIDSLILCLTPEIMKGGGR